MSFQDLPRNRQRARRLGHIHSHERTDEPPTQYESREVTYGDPYHEYSDYSVADSTRPPSPALETTAKTKPRRNMVKFSGKPSDIDNVLTHCTATFAAEETTKDSKRCGYLASLFTGAALSWLTSKLKKNPGLLTDWDDFTSEIRTAFELNDSAKAGQVARQLAYLKQQKDVQSYALKFKPLSEEARLPNEIAQATFVKGLKPHIQRALITSDDYKDLDELITEATRIDSELYNLQRYGSRPAKFGGNRDKGGKFKSQNTNKNFKMEYE